MTRMAIPAAAAAIVLLLFLQVPRIHASEIIKTKVCGADHLAFFGSSGDESLYVNGCLVERSFFCDALVFHHENGCFFEHYWYADICGLDLPQVKLPHSGRRKLLQTHMMEGAPVVKISQLSENKDKFRTFLTSKTVDVAVPGTLVLCCVILCPCFYRKRKKMDHAALAKEPSSVNSLNMPELGPVPGNIPRSPLRVPPSPARFLMSPKLNALGSAHLDLNQIVKATRNFSPSMVVGEGGFGTVYRVQLEDGQVVAIKRAKKEHFESLRTEFSSEVELLAKIDHRCLVKLLGYFDKGNERLIVTEYVPNGTLRAHLDGLGGRILDFNQRLEIAIDVAHGLTYLHMYAEKPIIHRDVKSSNILLTDSMRAKVADFGFARLGTAADSDKTHISTKVKGTIGYLDPEYMRTYQLTAKSDVYSFGILLLEIITGRRPVEQNRPVEERVTLRWVFRKFNEGNVVELVDHRMGEVVDAEILARIISLAIQCAAPIRLDRPDMKIVGEQLWGLRVDYLNTVRRR